jgi:hypothetical protein
MKSICFYSLQKTTVKNEEYEVEIEKVKKDREIAMKQKDALVKTLSEAANALESSLKVRNARWSRACYLFNRVLIYNFEKSASEVLPLISSFLHILEEQFSYPVQIKVISVLDKNGRR